MAHTASLFQLQTPKWALVNGELTEYADVRIHIGAEGVAGTIAELTLVDEVDGYRFDQSGLLVQVRQAYLKAMRGDVTVDDVAMVPLV